MQEQMKEMNRAIKDIQAKSKGKQTYSGEDFYNGLDGDDNLENLPRKFLKFDGTGNPKAHLATFYAECGRFRKDNRALFICFPRSLEGVAARWYADHINPIELREFDKVVNLFIERFMFNVEASPTLNHLYNLKQNENEKASEFIHRWRSTCNRMKVPVPEEYALQIILNNFAQPLRNLISTSPAKSFIKLIERAEWLETGLDNGLYEGYPFVRGNPDQKKKAHVAYSTEFSDHGSGSNSKKSKKNRRTRMPDILGPKGQIQQPRRENLSSHSPSSQHLSLKQGSKKKPKHEGWSYDREFTALEQSREDILEYMMSKGMIKLPKVADPPVAMGKWTDKFCKFHRTVGHDTEHCFVLKNIIQDCIDKNLLIEDEEEQPKSCPSHFLNTQLQSSQSRHSFFKVAFSHVPIRTFRINIRSWSFVKRSLPPRGWILLHFPATRKQPNWTSQSSGRHCQANPRIPKRFVKAASKKEEASGSVQKPITALSNISILDLTHASPEHQQVLEDLLRKIKVKPSTTPQDMAQIVNQAMTNAPITFSDEDLPKPHSFHNNALYSGANQGHDSPSCA